mgnify:CR=1 FL=1
MKKEIIIAIFIISLVSISDIVTTKITDEKMIDIGNKLETLEVLIQENMKEENLEKRDIENKKIKNYVIDVKNEWINHEEILSLYIEHEELEKIGTEVNSLYSYIESNDDTECLDSIARLEFILEHLSKKQDFRLNNFF